MTDTDTNFFRLKNKIINCNRKAKTSKTNYLAHTRQNIESFLSQMLYIISLNLKQSWMSHCACVYITCSTPDAAYKGKDDYNLLCLFTFHPNKQQSLHHLPIFGTHCAGMESKLMEGLAPALQVLHTAWQSKDNAGANQCFKMLSGAQKSVQKDSKHRLKLNSHSNHTLYM